MLAAAWPTVRKFALRIPFGPLFGITAVLLFVLSVVFTGRGVFALQLASWLPSMEVVSLPLQPLLGIYPSLQAVGAQLLVAAAGAGWMLWTRRRLQVANQADPAG